MAGFEGLNPTFAQRLQALIGAAPGSVTLISGHRTTEQQARLYAKLGPRLAARPGHSNHEKGLAGDLRFDSDRTRAWVHANAARFGLNFPMSWEPWHIEPLGLREGSFDPDAYSDPHAHGEIEGEVEVERLPRAFARIFGRPIDSNAGLFGDIVAGLTKQQAKVSMTGGGSGGTMDVRQAVALARQAGFSGDALATAVAVAMAESRLNPRAEGDKGLANRTWGPSLGLWQIRSVNAERGTGGWRDAAALYDPAFNARAAYAISGQGTNFRPWTQFTSGAYRQYLPQVRKILGEVTA